MIFIPLILFGCALFLANFPKLMLGQYRDQLVGLDEVLAFAPDYDLAGRRVARALLPFGAFFFSAVTFSAIPNWQMMVFVSPAFAAVVSGIIGNLWRVLDLSRTPFFSNKYFVGELAASLSARQIFLSVGLIGLTILIRVPLGAIRI